THLREDLGGGSLTALPIIETEAQNMAAYIPTNLISITDGQLYLSPTLFELGLLPAIDIGRSVSRVGDKAQLQVYRTATGSLKLEHAQFEELESFARFGTRLDERTKHILEHGRRIRAVLKQPELQPVPVVEQVVLLLALNKRLFDDIPLADMKLAEAAVRQVAAALPEDFAQAFFGEEKLSEAQLQTISALCTKVLEPFKTGQL
ncbi:MAG: F0F1 ATP synthase subunit alpha, partial [Saprospiraceae bacterium]|nr:F0F1 ATP synthase subunit alpha [Saprospiraceae bacterium]